MAGHIFLSYVREDSAVVDRLASDLTGLGFEVWLDRDRLAPGQRWRDAIREAIRAGDLFVACFSRQVVARDRTHMNEELVIAIEELRLRPTDRTWFIPARLDSAEVASRSIGAGETLRDLQWVDLGSDWQAGVEAIAKVAFSHRHAAKRKGVSVVAAANGGGSEAIVERIARIDRLRAEAEEREKLLSSEAGVGAALAERDRLYATVAERARSLSAQSKTFRIDVEVTEPTIAIRAAGHTILISWTHKYTNSLSESGLYVLEYERSYFLGGGINLDNPRELKRTRYSFDLRDGINGWSAAGTFMTTDELSEHCVSLLLGYAEVRK